MSQNHVFTLANGQEIQYTRLKLREQMKLWPLVAKDLAPIIQAIPDLTLDPDQIDFAALAPVLGSASSLLENLETYLDRFLTGAKFTRVQKDGTSHANQPVRLFEAEVLTSGPVLIEFVLRVGQIEFGDFLKELGKTELRAPSPETASP